MQLEKIGLTHHYSPDRIHINTREKVIQVLATRIILVSHFDLHK